MEVCTVSKKNPPLLLPLDKLVMMKWDEAYIFDKDKNEDITQDVASITSIDSAHYAVTFRNGNKSCPYKKSGILYLKDAEEK